MSAAASLLAEVLDELALHGADLLPRQLRHRAPVPQPLEVVRVDLDEERHLLALAQGVPRRVRHLPAVRNLNLRECGTLLPGGLEGSLNSS